jgi:phage gp46-like protein
MAHSGEPCVDYRIGPFRTGLAVQPVSDCLGTNCLDVLCSQPDIAVSGGRLRTDNWIRSWIMTQLLTQARIPKLCDLPNGSNAPRGWWADSYRQGGFTAGSLLWTISFTNGVNEAAQYAQLYAMTALQWLRKWGIVEEITVSAKYTGQGTLQLDVVVSGPSRSGPLALVVSGVTLPDMGWVWKAQ